MKNVCFCSAFCLLLVLFSQACTSGGEDAIYSSELLKSDIFRADPEVIRDCLGENGKTTLHWDVPNVRRIEIHVDSAEGNLFAIAGGQGSKETGYWVKDGMQFVLLEADTGEELAAISVKVLCGE